MDAEELRAALAYAQETPTYELADHFSTLLISLESPGPCWLSPEDTRATWQELVARRVLTAH